MLIKFTETSWLNIELDDVCRIDVEASVFENLTENAAYYVKISLNNGAEYSSDLFKTKGEATQCAKKLVQALIKEEYGNEI